MRIKPTGLGTKIRELYHKGDFDGIGNLDGFRIVELRDNRSDERNQYGCVTWIFSGNKDQIKGFTSNPLFPSGYEEVNHPKKGDIVVYLIPARLNRYFADFDPAQLTHAGIYAGDGRVHSKFRESHVYEHPLEAIPPEYGSEVKFFRKLYT